MFTSRYKPIIEKILQFKSKVKIPLDLVSNHLLDDLYIEEPKLAVYVRSIKSSSFFGMVYLDIQYWNTDFPKEEIYYANNSEELVNLMGKVAGDYKPKAVAILPKMLDVAGAINKFQVKEMTFYPNLMNFECKEVISTFKRILTIEFKYRVSRADLEKMEREVDKEVARLCKMLFLPSMPEEAKVYMAHNYLATTVQYELLEKASAEAKSYMQSAYGALIKKKCVCQGYAEAFKRILNEVGIKCDVVGGKVFGMPNYHAWNIVTLKTGKSYHIDVTWASQSFGVIYDYYGKSDDFMAKDRNWNVMYNPRCNSTLDILTPAKEFVKRNAVALLRQGLNAKILNVR